MALGGLELSLMAKAEYIQGQVQKASALSNGIQRNCKHTLPEEANRSNLPDHELRCLTNNIRPSCSSSQRDHPFLDGRQ